MWVFAAGMFRSGSTLQFQIIADMIERSGMGQRCEWSTPESFGSIADKVGDAANRAGPMRVFKTHVCKHPMRERLRDGRAMAVGVHRDLRDVVVSGAQKRGITPTPEYAREVVAGCLACWDGWPSGDSVRWWSYERLTSQTRTVTIEMCEHLGVPCSPQDARDMSDRYSPEEQRARIERAIADDSMQPSQPGWKSVHMSRELLHPGHVRDGQTGKWRESLTKQNVDAIESLAEGWLVGRGYRLSREIDELELPCA